jgi:hypothetical protein
MPAPAEAVSPAAAGAPAGTPCAVKAPVQQESAGKGRYEGFELHARCTALVASVMWLQDPYWPAALRCQLPALVLAATPPA